MSEIEWKDPPRHRRKVDVVAAQLRGNPGRWARIAHAPGIALLSWWAPLYSAEGYEVKFVYTGETTFGPKDVYARYVGESDADPDPKP